MTGEEGVVRAVRQILIEERRNWIRRAEREEPEHSSYGRMYDSCSSGT